jgi:predicted glycogen debranching enzyme
MTLQQVSSATYAASDTSFCVTSGLQKEWLLTDGQGGFASGTVIGAPARRYHGLLIASARPPLERWMLLSSVLARVSIDGVRWETPTFDFGDTIHPSAHEQQVDFATGNAPPCPWVRFGYRFGRARFTQVVALPHGRNEAVITFRIEAARGRCFRWNCAPLPRCATSTAERTLSEKGSLSR